MRDLRMLFGFVLVLLLAALAGMIALGKVEEMYSFGLGWVASPLGGALLIWATWAFKKD